MNMCEEFGHLWDDYQDMGISRIFKCTVCGAVIKASVVDKGDHAYAQEEAKIYDSYEAMVLEKL